MSIQVILPFFMLVLCSLSNGAFAGSSEDVLKARMISDLDIIKNSFEVRYAPLQWKKEHHFWDLNSSIEHAKMEVHNSKNITVKDFQYILREFFHSMRDYHVLVRFHSTESAFLPFKIQEAEGKYYVSWIKKGLEKVARRYPSEEIITFLNTPISVGDEIVEFNGEPIQNAIAELKKKYFGDHESDTNSKLAEILLTLRLGVKGEEVPQGLVSVAIRHKGSEKVSKYQLHWFYVPEEITNQAAPVTQGKGAEFALDPFFIHQRWIPLYDDIRQAEERLNLAFGFKAEEDSPDTDHQFLGAVQSFLPPLGKVKWRWPGHSFDAYLFENAKGKPMGFLRIAEYFPAATAMDDLGQILSYFNAHADALVIDQMNNPGGNVFYLFGILSMLTDKPLEVLQEKVTLTQEDVARALRMRSSLEIIETEEDIRQQFKDGTLFGFTVDHSVVKGLISHCDFVINEWKKGHFFTTTRPIYGIGFINPHPKVRYKKPILLLINQKDFSCGDLMPAILQDNKRALVMGAKTAGAGGYVLSMNYPNRFGIDFYSLTGSLAFRKNKKPLEDLGVTPDIVYKPTKRDMTERHADFVQAIHDALNKIIK